jgi:hypothetical protein
MAEVTDLKTPVSAETIGRAFLDEVPGLGRQGLRLLLAHWASETGWGKEMHNWNVGNAKSSGKSGDWTFFKCGETVALATAREWEKTGLVTIDSINAAGTKATVTVYPKHPACRFAAYPDLAAGVKAYLNLLIEGYRQAWDVAILGGTSEEFARALNANPKRIYYTASVASYVALMDGVIKSVERAAPVVLASVAEESSYDTPDPLAPAATPPVEVAAVPPSVSSSSSPSSGYSFGGGVMRKVSKLAIAIPAFVLVGLTMMFRKSSTDKLTPAALRAAIVSTIEGEMDSPDPEKYWADVLDDDDAHPAAWCGALILWAHRTVGTTDAHWVRGQGIATPLKLKVIPSSAVQIGDVAYFERYQHVATVSKGLGGGKFEILNGNGEGGAITRTETTTLKVKAFFSIGHLVGEV